MPETLVLVAPITERNSAGAVILGSNVSTWVGPPPSQSQTTEVFFVGLPASAAAARALSKSDRERPATPRPRAPILRKSRRLAPSHVAPWRELRNRSMVISFLVRAAFPRAVR